MSLLLTLSIFHTLVLVFLEQVNAGWAFEDGIFAELCLKLWLESDWYICKIRVRMVLKVTAQKQSSKQPLPQVGLKK